MTESLYLLLPISVLFVIAIGVAFWWAIFSGQFDDADSAANAILFQDCDDTEDEENSALEGKPDHGNH